MKIGPSLKIYFIVAMLLLGLAMAVFFSSLTLNYFVQGLDRGIRQSMTEVAEVEGVKEGAPALILGYHIASVWQDLPLQVKEVFADTPPIESNILEKKVINSHFFAPPKEMYLVLKVTNKSGHIRYISKVINKHNLPPKPQGIPHVLWIGIFALSSIGFFFLVVIFIIRKVTKPVESLKNWAKSLDADKLEQPIPDFQYRELNQLAEIVNSSLSSVQESLARELQFLSYASHELRTPITVVRANTELLLKLQEKEGTTKQSVILERIDRAGKTMTSLTETLLWLSRDDTELPECEKVDIAQLLEQLVVELNYLLKNKAIQLDVITEPYHVNAAIIPCRIVLANLIRNAFQHTMEGKVIISQVKGNVSIINTSEDEVVDRADLGFGLGLQLTKKLAGRYGWLYRDNIEARCYQVEIQF